MAHVNRSLLVSATLLLAAVTARAQDPVPNPQEMQMRVQQIMQQRPREAEAAARSFLLGVAPDRVAGLDSLRDQANNRDAYWMEVAQLTVQFDMVQKVSQRDGARAELVGKMFGLEANARAQQRAYRAAAESARPAIRTKIEALITQHFDLEDQLRALEVADIERRLADVRAETQRRHDRRAEFIRWAVDDIVRDAMRPQ